MFKKNSVVDLDYIEVLFTGTGQQPKHVLLRICRKMNVTTASLSLDPREKLDDTLYELAVTVNCISVGLG